MMVTAGLEEDKYGINNVSLGIKLFFFLFAAASI